MRAGSPLTTTFSTFRLRPVSCLTGVVGTGCWPDGNPTSGEGGNGAPAWPGAGAVMGAGGAGSRVGGLAAQPRLS
jgi:hypothetical protein